MTQQRRLGSTNLKIDYLKQSRKMKWRCKLVSIEFYKGLRSKKRMMEELEMILLGIQTKKINFQ